MDYCLYQKGEDFPSAASSHFGYLIPYIIKALEVDGEVKITLEDIVDDFSEVE